MKDKKEKKDIKKILLIVLIVLLALEVILIPFLYMAQVKKLLPVVFFIILPTTFGIVIVLLSRNCTTDYDKKKNKIIEKLNS